MATNTTDRVVVTADDKGPIIAIAVWFPMVVMIMAVILRVTIKLRIRRAMGSEDYTITAALVSKDSFDDITDIKSLVVVRNWTMCCCLDSRARWLR